MQRRSIIALASPGWAQANYPDKPITMVVPAPPGGGTELIAWAKAIRDNNITID